MKAPVVEIHVHGGVASIVRKDAGVRVTLRDFDNHPKGDHSERYAISDVIVRDNDQEEVTHEAPTGREQTLPAQGGDVDGRPRSG